jgi:hypothetical protein
MVLYCTTTILAIALKKQSSVKKMSELLGGTSSSSDRKQAFKHQIYSIFFVIWVSFLSILNIGRDLANQANSDSVRMSGYVKL